MRRASPSCALARLDEQAFLRRVRAALPASEACDDARARGLVRLREFTFRTPVEAEASAARRRARGFEGRHDNESV